MKRINISELIPGMVTAEDVYSFNNQLILSKATVLTDKSITKLEFYSVFSLKIEDQILPTETPIEYAEDVSYFSKIQNSAEFHEFQEQYETGVESFRQNINDIVEKNAPLDVNALLEQTMSLLSTSHGRVNVFDMLHNMRLYSDLTYIHSVNVALICNVFAGWLGLSEQDIETATLCGLMHDIGKLMIPDNILEKPDKLTEAEYSIITTHPTEGYRILTRIPDIQKHICNSALMHHERCDGSGYPLKLDNLKIDKFAKIVAIADVYDAMTSARIYRGPQCPFTVIELFENEGFHKYDTEYILVFLEHIIATYLSNSIRLNNGQIGTIIFINQHALSRPVIKCKDEFIDLSTRPDLHIEALI